MQATEITDDFIGGTLEYNLTGTIRSIIRGPGWRELQIDPGLPGGESAVQLRIFDSDPIEFEATEGTPVLNPPGESQEPEMAESDPS